MKERLEFDIPKTMDELTKKVIICYQQMKQKGDNSKKWMEKGPKQAQNSKWFKS